MLHFFILNFSLMKSIYLSIAFVSIFLFSSFNYYNSNNTSLPPQYSEAKITGSNVIIRASASTTAGKKGSLKLNQRVTVLDTYFPSDNRNEAVLRYKTDFTNEYSGNFVFSLNSGRAVKVIESLGGDSYRISFIQANGDKGFAKINGERLEFINGEKWYKIETSTGLTGWVFGKFVQEIY